MKLTYIVSVDLDEVRLREDRPPGGVGAELREEIASHLHSLNQVFAVESVSVTAVPEGGSLDRLVLSPIRLVPQASETR